MPLLAGGELRQQPCESLHLLVFLRFAHHMGTFLPHSVAYRMATPDLSPSAQPPPAAPSKGQFHALATSVCDLLQDGQLRDSGNLQLPENMKVSLRVVYFMALLVSLEPENRAEREDQIILASSANEIALGAFNLNPNENLGMNDVPMNTAGDRYSETALQGRLRRIILNRKEGPRPVVKGNEPSNL
ncbi:Interleukin-1 receptor type 1 [Fukomys damarensis]|uniref:Interleukin-1 receptor type 1 n=1 Tax=Fukomys damarensis TaxID=885580 RepID=A0A091DVX0_FUKDA|nr:Interleukin-1 receptor type 1 [Fukomys damarensis]